MDNFITVAWNAAANGRYDWTIMNVNRPADDLVEVWLKYCGPDKRFWGTLEAVVQLEKMEENPPAWRAKEVELKNKVGGITEEEALKT